MNCLPASRERVAPRDVRLFARERHGLSADASVSPPRCRARVGFERRRLASRASQRLLSLVHRLRRAREPKVPRAPIDRRGDFAVTVRVSSTASSPATRERRRRVRRTSRRPRRVPRYRRHRRSRAYHGVQRVVSVPARSCHSSHISRISRISRNRRRTSPSTRGCGPGPLRRDGVVLLVVVVVVVERSAQPADGDERRSRASTSFASSIVFRFASPRRRSRFVVHERDDARNRTVVSAGRGPRVARVRERLAVRIAVRIAVDTRAEIRRREFRRLRRRHRSTMNGRRRQTRGSRSEPRRRDERRRGSDRAIREVFDVAHGGVAETVPIAPRHHDRATDDAVVAIGDGGDDASLVHLRHLVVVVVFAFIFFETVVVEPRDDARVENRAAPQSRRRETFVTVRDAV